MSNPSGPDNEWDELHEAGGAAVRWTGRFIGRSINRATSLARDTRKAFQQGLDPNVDDAVVVEEYDERRQDRR